MGRRLWYPDRFDVEVIAHRLAVRLFPGYADVPAGSFLGAPLDDNPLLESALALPRQPYYRTTIDKAGALLRSMVKNHPFVDGNKRLGMAVTFIFLLNNRYFFTPPNDEMVRFALELAASEPDMSWRKVAQWIRTHSVPFYRADAWRVYERDPSITLEKLGRALQWTTQLEAAISELRPEFSRG